MAFVYFFHGGLILSYSFVRIFVYQKCKLFVLSIANSFTRLPVGSKFGFWYLWILKKSFLFPRRDMSVFFLTAVFGVVLHNLLCYRYSSTF